jgi:hypothetical protein
VTDSGGLEDVFDLLDHAVEPDAWECEGDWEYRAMHWRPSSAGQRVRQPDASVS